MAIEYSLNKIKNFFVGKDILGRDAIVHSRVTFLMKRVPKEMADATRAGYLSHASCFVNLPYPAIGDWDDQIPPIIRVEEFTLTEEGREPVSYTHLLNGSDGSSTEATLSNAKDWKYIFKHMLYTHM